MNQKGLAPIEIDHRLKEDILKDSQQIQPQIKKFDSGNPEILRAKDIDPFGCN